MGFDRQKFSLAARRLVGLVPPNPVSDDVIEQQLSLQICSETAEESGAAAVFKSARDMARQGDWEEISALIMVHDRARDMTPDGTPLAELVSAGARADISLALHNAAQNGHLTERHRSISALRDFCADLSEADLGYGAALLAAETEMEAGWAWYQQGNASAEKTRYLTVFQSYFDKAADRLAPYCALGENAPALAAANCALLAGRADAVNRVLDEYEDLLDLNPRAPGHLRAFGLHLMPQWFGSYAILDVQARRAAVQTKDVWGCGAYAWVWLDALALDPDGFAFLDMPFFLDAIDDILARRSSQHFVNLFAAYLSRYVDMDDGGPDRGQRQALLRRRAGLVRGRMEELHPWVWSNGALSDIMKLHLAGIDVTSNFEAGQALARQALAEVFSHELVRGKAIGSASI